MGWRYTLFTLGLVSLAVFFLRSVFFQLQESPQYLIYHGRDAEAIEVLEHIARTNRRHCGVSMADFEALKDEEDEVVYSQTTQTRRASALSGGGSTSAKSRSLVKKLKAEMARYGMLFADAKMARLTTLVWITYGFDYFGFSIGGEHHPPVFSSFCVEFFSYYDP